MNFTFRAEWLEAAQALNSPALQAELLMAITTYGVTGNYSPSKSAVINALMIVIKAQIDSTPSRRKALKDQPVPSTSESSDVPDKIDIIATLSTSDLTDKLIYPKRNLNLEPIINQFAEKCHEHNIRFTDADTCRSHFIDYVNTDSYLPAIQGSKFFQDLSG